MAAQPSNRQLLLMRRMSVLAIPPGGGFADGVAFFTDKDKRHAVTQEAEAWVVQALAAVRGAAEPNPWRDASDDTIAGEILRQAGAR